MNNIENLIEKLQSIRLLYVEDNVEARESTLILFKDIFSDITVAVDGQDGLNKFQNGNFDLIITDISMPNMDGLEMVTEIRKVNKDISIIFLTALKSIETVIKAIDIGVDSFINKPLEDIDLLFNKLNGVLEKIELKKILKDKEKVDSILKLLHLIEHHWRQPLSLISTISSGCIITKELNTQFTQEDLDNANKITTATQNLSKMLDEIKKIDFHNSTVEEIEQLISISNNLVMKDVSND